LKVIGLVFMCMSGFWLTQEFDWTLLGWFFLGLAITIPDQIMSRTVLIFRKNINGK
jgi:hypothetical protein